ncbi:DUF2199 domain-containing protein [Hymenobacter lapidiphilus]|uniref:DUF2199 domain-containing protein n=1 Tax=Hymenobacter lapidiphilus TaxID=2608003 RepID=A0A7Y7PQ48_9BACT|nr:DUF2199 domain-containing protein [Hymenobacter lapidiphilus]NVO31804.1 DUF2199 domain-containing protein [Hymenobacter lapidiphilus]
MQHFVCPTCGETHAGPSFCFGAEYPDFYFSIPLAERDERIEINKDLCVVDESHFFIRGRIEIPIIGHDEPFCWNVWTSLSKENFVRVNELWHEIGREQEPPYFGWLQTVLPGYPNTLSIKTTVHTQPVGTIPKVRIIEEAHPLLIEQEHGVTMERALQIVHGLFHSDN